MPNHQWLGATSCHSLDPTTPPLITSIAALTDAYLQLHVIVNLFDTQKVDPAAYVAQHSGGSTRVEGTNVPGMKTLFWKLKLTPERTRGLRAVWLFDSDIAVHPAAFPLGQLVGVLRSTHATLLQPSVRALVHGTHHTFLRVRPAHMSCLATTAMWVEMQTPIFAGEAWAAYHDTVLSHVADRDLAMSDFGIDISWCAAVRASFPSRPACLVTPSEAATHLNSHAIEKFGDKGIVHTRSCEGTCKTLLAHYRRFWRNFSHHTGACYGVQLGGQHQWAKGLVPDGRFGIDNAGYARARRDNREANAKHWSARSPTEALRKRLRGIGSAGQSAQEQGSSFPDLGSSKNASDAAESVVMAGESATAALEAEEEAEAASSREVLMLGATSIGSREGTRLGNLVSGLRVLLEAVPKLRIVINHPDGGSTRDGGDASVDLRITTTWVKGSRMRFWRDVLEPHAVVMRGVAYVWLFDAALALHPSVNPLQMLLDALRATDASVLFANADGASFAGRRLAARKAAASTAASSSPAVASGTGAARPLSRLERCAVVGARRRASPHLSPFVLVRRDAWTAFWEKALTRLDDPRVGSAILRAYSPLLCGLMARHFPGRPACVEAADATYAVHVLERRPVDREERSTTGYCESGSKCAYALHTTFGAHVYNATALTEDRIENGTWVTIDGTHPLCWILGVQKDGLSLDRVSRFYVRLVQQARRDAIVSFQQARHAQRQATSKQPSPNTGGTGAGPTKTTTTIGSNVVQHLRKKLSSKVQGG